MFRITFSHLTGYFKIRDEHGQVLFASTDKHTTEATLMALRLDSDPAYQNWLAANDPMLEAA